MSLSERFRTILIDNQLKQKELASILGLTPSYISGLLSERNKAISPTLAERIENRLGYRAEWVLTGKGPKMKTVSKVVGLSPSHQRAIAQLEAMTESEARAVLAFIRALPEVEEILTE